MVLNVHSDASYLIVPKARSPANEYVFLGSLPKDRCPIHLNSTVLTLCTILKCAAASDVEAKLGTLFLKAAETKITRLTLKEMGHPQPPTPIHVNNLTDIGIVNNTIKRQRSCVIMGMRHFWLFCHGAQRSLPVAYQLDRKNLGDY